MSCFGLISFLKTCFYLYFSVFDKVDHSRFVERGIQHVLYQPLAVDDVRIREWDSEHDDQAGERYLTDICFVGNLYEDNFYDVFCRNIPQILQDYFMGIFERAAFRWDGINRVYGSVNDELIAYMKKTVPDFQPRTGTRTSSSRAAARKRANRRRFIDGLLSGGVVFCYSTTDGGRLQWECGRGGGNPCPQSKGRAPRPAPTSP